jgi:hypothetical protein
MLLFLSTRLCGFISPQFGIVRTKRGKNEVEIREKLCMVASFEGRHQNLVEWHQLLDRACSVEGRQTSELRNLSSRVWHMYVSRSEGRTFVCQFVCQSYVRLPISCFDFCSIVNFFPILKTMPFSLLFITFYPQRIPA